MLSATVIPLTSSDRDSGVRDIPVPRCPACHQPTYRTVAGVTIHTDPNNRCTYGS